MNSLTRYILTIFLLIVLLLPARLVRAHGGFVIDSGASDTYEWVVSIFPYPVPVGATVISILLFEKTMGIPAMDLSGEVYLAEPGDTRPCCQPGVQRGPFLLTSNHDIYPGDYTAFIPVDAPGRWQVLFKMKAPTGDYGIVTGFDAIPYGDGSQPVDKPAIATQVAIAFSAASIVSKQNTSASGTPQPNSPLVQAISPLAESDSLASQPAIVVTNSASNRTSTISTQPQANNRLLLLIGGLGFIILIGVISMILMGRRNQE